MTTLLRSFLTWILLIHWVKSEDMDAIGINFVLSAENLEATLHGIPDAYVNVFLKTAFRPDLEKIGSTEIIYHDKNPQWATLQTFAWDSKANQKLVFEVKDSNSFEPNDIIGGAEVEVEDYVRKGGRIWLSLGRGNATISLRKVDSVTFRVAVKDVPMLDKGPRIFSFFESGLPDPYVECYFRNNLGGREHKFFTTRTADNTRNHEWSDPIQFKNYLKGTGQYLRFKVKDSDAMRSDDDAGEALIALDAFVKGHRSVTVDLQLNDEKTGAKLTITPIPKLIVY